MEIPSVPCLHGDSVKISLVNEACLVRSACGVRDLSGIWSFVVHELNPDTSWHRKRGRGLGAGSALLQVGEDQRSGQIID